MKKVLAAMTIAGSVLALSACSGSNEVVVKTEVGNITQDEFYKALKVANGTTVLEQMIEEKVLESKFKVTNKELDKEMEKVKSQFKTDDEFKAALASSGIEDEKVLREQMKLNLLQYKSVTEGVDASEVKLKAYYDKNVEKYNTTKAQHILVETEDLAKTIKTRLDAGEDFAALAKEFSKDTASAEKGGDLGEFGKGDMVEEFDNVAFSIELNKISDPVKSEFGYHIIKVSERKQKTYDEAKEAVKNDFLEENAKDYTEVIADLKAKAKIEIKDEDLNTKKSSEKE